MARILTACLLAISLLGCGLFRGRAPQDFFVLFFVPGTTRLSPEAQQIVRQAADDARTERAKIVIAIPPDTPGGVRLVEGRRTAVENILSAAGTDAKLYSTVPLATAGTAPQGAIDRAEVRLVR